MPKAVTWGLLSLVLIGAPSGVSAGEATSKKARSKRAASTPVWIDVGADDPNIQYTGRFDFSNPKGPQFSWPGCSITARFRGTAVNMIMTNPPTTRRDDGDAPFHSWYEILIDGKIRRTVVIRPDRRVYKLASRLKNTAHTVTIFRRTEPVLGVSTFRGLQLIKGQKMLPPPPRPKRRIEVIGDSITAGLNAIRVGRSMCSISAENNYVTYGAVAARKLGAEYSCIAYSGGSVNGHSGKGLLMPKRFLRTLADDPNSKWDFSTWKPHVVTIHLSTNDLFFPKGKPHLKECVAAYVAFIRVIRKHYPKAHIFCLNGPIMNWGPVQRDFAKQTIDVFRKKGDKRIHYLEFDNKLDEDGTDIHPDPATHRKMGDVLAEAIREKLGWTDKAPKPTPVAATPKPAKTVKGGNR